MAAELSRAEKLAGRAFRERAVQAMDLAFSEMPETTEVRPLYLNFVRHVCPKHEGRTWAVQLKEYVLFSPRMYACYCSAVLAEPHVDCDGAVEIEESLFGWIWRAGSCPCGYTVRSHGGRIVLAGDRGPLHGAVRLGLDPPG
jgi:hypothetical protein